MESNPIISSAYIERVNLLSEKGVDKKRAYQHYIEWRELPSEQRDPKSKAAFARLYGMTDRTLANWDERIENPPKEKKLKKKRIPRYDSETYLKARTLEVDKRLIDTILKDASPKNIETFYKLTGRKLVDKSEVDVKIGLSAQEYFRIWEEAKRRSGGNTNGNRGLLAESTVLSEEVRSD